MGRRYASGFTLVELVVTIAVAAILVAVALPSFRHTLRTNRLASANNEFLAAVGLARTEAMRNRLGAGICAANADATACAGTTPDWADNGWVVWADTTRVVGFQAGDRVLRASQALPELTFNVTQSGASLPGGALLFDMRGRSPTSAAGAVVSIKPADCTTGDADMQRDIAINMSGQTRSQRVACQTSP